MPITASERSVSQILGYPVQYVIPPYQRPYEWDRTRWQTLWDDLLETQKRIDEGLGYHHFFGPIVTIASKENAPGVMVARYFLIDGQQRLTTLQILLRAFFDTIFEELKQGDGHFATATLTANTGNPVDYVLKISPGRYDRPAFAKIFGEKVEGIAEGQLLDAHRFFRERVSEYIGGYDSSTARQRIDALTQTLAQRFMLVAINIDEQEQVYEIFQSLNAKGTLLAECDKVRNLCFMRLAPLGKAGFDTVYKEHWMPLEDEIKAVGALQEFPSNFDRFMLIWTILFTGEQFGERSIASEFKNLMERWVKQHATDIPAAPATTVIADFVKILCHYGKAFRVLSDPSALGQPWETGVRKKLQLVRLLGLGGAADPLLLELLHRYGAYVQADVNGILRCLDILESFVVRRRICGLRGKQDNRIFSQLASKLRNHPADTTLQQIADAVFQSLDAKNPDSEDRWPKDSELLQSFITNRIFYFQNNRKIVKKLLECIERSHPGGATFEDFDGFTVEHIMPQNLTPEWEHYLGADAEGIRSRKRDTFGNLTLVPQAWQGKLGQQLQPEKCFLYKSSELAITREICNFPAWREPEIEQRATLLFETAKKRWPRIL